MTRERSQLKNKELAMQMLRAKLFTMQQEEQAAKIASARKMQATAAGPAAWQPWCQLVASAREG